MKIGGLRGDILFKSKEYPLALPKKDSRGDFVFPPGTPLKRPKGAAAPLWKPLFGDGRGCFFALGWGAGCLRSCRAFWVVGDEVWGGLVDLEAVLGVRRL